ncbi:DUF4437 domain-containing protein [Denitrobaculum tricleocarpae]|uniref:DUF4437 domain-containing protein n=1 Tax=Denitrobaculum tricleocarpae TaxID=2591009 RepID=UPI0015D3A1F9|nr:DUF4437 domain-containing protein [Denitrobaculum tricleocarpae]
MLGRTAVSVAAALLAASGVAQAQPDFELVARPDVSFQALNPLRGEASPKAGVLWGDIRNPAATGTLVQFRDGFSSPPHIHNITYRAVVISGEVHNDDPEAAQLWMGPGSFWTQPAGETHVTSAQGEATKIFLEILEGPYLVRPKEEAFDNGERPVNIEARNVVWLDPSDVSWIDAPRDALGPQMAFLWGEPGDNGRNGTFLRLPAGFDGILSSAGDWLKAVVIEGIITHQRTDSKTRTRLEPGSYFGTPTDIDHALACDSSAGCLLYVSAKGKFAFSSR